MKINIVKIVDAGVVGKERLRLKATDSENIGSYVVFDTVQIEPGKISSHPKNVYWFPDRTIVGGDTIVLYTKTGKNFQRKKEDGTTTWFFYWGNKEILWSNKDSSAVLLKIDEWKYKIRS